MICPKCDSIVDDNVNDCPFCGIVIAKYNPNPTPRTVKVAEPEIKTQKRSNLPFLLVALLIAGGLATWYFLRPKTLPRMELTHFTRGNSETVICTTKKHCVLVYLSPRNKASKRSIDTVLELKRKAAKDENLSLIIIIGKDNSSELKKMARRIGGEIYLDPQGKAFSKLGGEKIPHWYLFNHKDQYVRQLDGTYFPLETHFKKLGI